MRKEMMPDINVQFDEKFNCLNKSINFHLKPIEQLTSFKPFEDDIDFFEWKLEDMSEIDVDFLTRKAYLIKGDEPFGKYKCINHKFGISIILLDIRYHKNAIYDKDLSIWNFVVKYENRDNWQETHLFTLYHTLYYDCSKSECKYYPNLFQGDKLVFDSICHIDINSSGQTIYNISDIGNKGGTSFYSKIVSGILLMGYFIQKANEDYNIKENYIENIKKQYSF